MSDEYQESCPSIEEELDYYKRTLAERDKELAEANAKVSKCIHELGEPDYTVIEKLSAQLLAAQTELASIPACVISEIICDRCGESGRISLPVPRTSTSPDPTLLDEVVKELSEIEETARAIHTVLHRDDCPKDDLWTPTIHAHATVIKEDAQLLLSRLRQPTRETEEKV